MEMRTQHANNCLAALDCMSSDYRKYHALFMPQSTDLKYYMEYIEYGHLLFSQGSFDVFGSMVEHEWSAFNFRHGVNSIEGTHGEMLSILIRNSYHSNTTGQSGPHDKINELTGKDCIIVNPRWSQPYTSQVKLLNINNSNILIKQRYLQYDIAEVDRLTLVDIQDKSMLEMSYPTIKEALMRDTIKHKRVQGGNVISIATLQSDNNMNFSTLRLQGKY